MLIQLFINFVLGPEVPQNNFHISVGQSSYKLELGEYVNGLCQREGKGMDVFLCLYSIYLCMYALLALFG